MTTKEYKKIINDIQKFIIHDAEKNDWLWFYDLHIKEAVAAAKELLRYYKANRQVVIIATWLHDVSKFKIKDKRKTKSHHIVHHQKSAEIADVFLSKYKISPKEKEEILNCIIRHRNAGEYLARTQEEKIVVVADVLSHFKSVFYFIHFKFNPQNSIDDMVREQLAKMEDDWEDLSLLPKAKKIVKNEYEILKKMHKNYLKKL